MSQAKISKIETGSVIPAPADVDVLARALHADDAEVFRLVMLAESRRNRVQELPPGRTDAAIWQVEIAQLEAAASTFRVFQPAVVSGLLQASEYARTVLARVQSTVMDPPVEPDRAVAEAVSGRMRRQEVLTDRNKEFRFVMPETLLRFQLGRADVMPAQLNRLREVARPDNVEREATCDIEPLLDRYRRHYLALAAAQG
ncbi:hypothetical protein Sya03_37180 [Spirilliplanes yamanashiensis]|uniref:DUF5753 domain-containing protein n=2 Tax=Spirilliplanes yamanashiensis TaxID=42233 RepID=A0A8J3Y9A0_9ACTN|nr:hypothetical protein [Spirilliplanes yamanashiensis]GIJ04366.1 hypothetical protein Sya03_37180 [Spirilliplanes yamanashiensis]